MGKTRNRTLFSAALAALVLVAGCAPPAAISNRITVAIDAINPFDDKPGKLTAMEVRPVASNPNRVWEVVGNFRVIGFWHPWALQPARFPNMDPRVEGATRVLPVIGGGRIEDRLIDWDGTRKSIRYASDVTTLPVSKFEAVITVTNNLDGSSSVTWSATFDADGVEDDQAVAAVREFFAAGRDNLATLSW